jgi:hypothetical protein
LASTEFSRIVHSNWKRSSESLNASCSKIPTLRLMNHRRLKTNPIISLIITSRHDSQKNHHRFLA